MISANFKKITDEESSVEVRVDGNLLPITKEFSAIVKAMDKSLGKTMTDAVISMARDEDVDKMFSESPESNIKNDFSNEEFINEVLGIAKESLATFEDDGSNAYSGKFIVVGSKKLPNEYFTIGKIYDVKDGRFTDDKGTNRPFNKSFRVKSYDELETLCEASYGIKIVEVKE